MNDRVRSDMPKPLLDYIGNGKFRMVEDFGMDDTTMMHWLFQENGETYRLQWWGSGWVVFYQESYLCKDLTFKHKSDISAFDYSHFPFCEPIEWQHLYDTRRDAVEAFKAHYMKLRGIEPSTDLRLYDKPLEKRDHLMTVYDWEIAVEDDSIMNEDGSGYWVKDGLRSRSEVFSSPQLDATHVVWYNK